MDKRIAARLAVSIGLVSFASNVVAADEPSYRLGQIIITSSRIPDAKSRQAREVAVITASDIKNSPQTAIQDIIDEVGTIDMRRRAPEGVQADVSIRGATFEASQVLVDGIKINDPQTGHYSMDLPVTRMDLEKIDIMKGPASSLYGPNAMGGTINLVTRRPEANAITAEVSGGSHDFVSGALSVSNLIGPLRNRFSFQEDRSTGYRPETEFHILTLAEHAYLEMPFGRCDFLFGYAKKDYGACDFYSNLYPNEKERTDTRFFKISSELEAGGEIVIKPDFFLRRHWDKFALDSNRPGWQTNYSTVYTYGGEIGFLLRTDFADVAYGFELARDTIDSTNMQRHAQTRDAMYVELNPHISKRLFVNLGFREDRYAYFGWEYSPSASASYEVNKYFKIRTTIGRSFRVPTFTDLYYKDAANIGDSGLNSETAWSYEGGLDFSAAAGTSFGITLFRRDQYNVIDWTRTSSKFPWQAKNVGSVDTNGLEMSGEINLKKGGLPDYPLQRLFVSNTMLDSYFKHDYRSKYAADYLRQQITGGIDLLLPFGLRNSWVMNYKKRVGDSGFVLVDAKLSREVLKAGTLKAEAFISGTNLFDVKYSEQSDIDMPRRWIKAGARAEF